MSSQEGPPESVCLTVSMQRSQARTQEKTAICRPRRGALGRKQTGQRRPGRPAPAARVDGCCCPMRPLFLSWQLELRQVAGVFKYVTEGEGSCSA